MLLVWMHMVHEQGSQTSKNRSQHKILWQLKFPSVYYKFLSGKNKKEKVEVEAESCEEGKS